MNPKIQKLRTELAKNQEKIDKLEARNAELRQQIRELEDLDIVGMVRAQGLSMEEFAKMLRYMQPSFKSKVSFRGRVCHPITPSASRGLDFPKYTPTPPVLYSWTSAGMYSIRSPG